MINNFISKKYLRGADAKKIIPSLKKIIEFKQIKLVLREPEARVVILHGIGQSEKEISTEVVGYSVEIDRQNILLRAICCTCCTGFVVLQFVYFPFNRRNVLYCQIDGIILVLDSNRIFGSCQQKACFPSQQDCA